MTHPPPRAAFSRADVIVVITMTVFALGLLIPACSKARVSDSGSVCAQSINNLKQMCLAMHALASRNEGLLSPSVGMFPRTGPNSSIFFHMLTDIEQDNVYKKYQTDPSKIPDTTNIKTFCAPLDVSNPGVNTNLISYASNAAVFGLQDGGSTRFPAAFNTKGLSNTILFMERYAVVGPDHIRHTWNGRGDRENYLYPPRRGALRPEEFIVPQYDVTPEGAGNDGPHAFSGSQSLSVGLADGSCRSITPAMLRTFTYGDGQTATIWAWACNIDGPLGEAKVPAGW